MRPNRERADEPLNASLRLNVFFHEIEIHGALLRTALPSWCPHEASTRGTGSSRPHFSTQPKTTVCELWRAGAPSVHAGRDGHKTKGLCGARDRPTDRPRRSKHSTHARTAPRRNTPVRILIYSRRSTGRPPTPATRRADKIQNFSSPHTVFCVLRPPAATLLPCIFRFACDDCAVAL